MYAVAFQFLLWLVHTHKILFSDQNMRSFVSNLCAARGPDTILPRPYKQDYLVKQDAFQAIMI